MRQVLYHAAQMLVEEVIETVKVWLSCCNHAARGAPLQGSFDAPRPTGASGPPPGRDESAQAPGRSENPGLDQPRLWGLFRGLWLHFGDVFLVRARDRASSGPLVRPRRRLRRPIDGDDGQNMLVCGPLRRHFLGAYRRDRASSGHPVRPGRRLRCTIDGDAGQKMSPKWARGRRGRISRRRRPRGGATCARRLPGPREARKGLPYRKGIAKSSKLPAIQGRRERTSAMPIWESRRTSQRSAGWGRRIRAVRERLCVFSAILRRHGDGFRAPHRRSTPFPTPSKGQAVARTDYTRLNC